jgi:hypothetical protein
MPLSQDSMSGQRRASLPELVVDPRVFGCDVKSLEPKIKLKKRAPATAPPGEQRPAEEVRWLAASRAILCLPSPLCRCFHCMR